MKSDTNKKQILQFLDEIINLNPDIKKYSSEFETIKYYLNNTSENQFNIFGSLLTALSEGKKKNLSFDSEDLAWLLSDLIETHSPSLSENLNYNIVTKKTSNYSDDIIWVINNSGKITESNSAFNHLFSGNLNANHSAFFIDLIQGADQINFWTEQIKIVFSNEYHIFNTTFSKFNFKAELICIGKLKSDSTNALSITFKAKIVTSKQNKTISSTFYNELEKLTGNISNSFLNTEYAFLDHLKVQALEAVSNLLETSSASIYYYKESNRTYFNKFNWQLNPKAFNFPVFEAISSTDFSEEEKILSQNGIVYITK